MRSLIVVLLIMALGAGRATAGLPAAVDGAPLPSLAPVLKRVMPGVVNIATYARVKGIDHWFDDPFFRRFFDMPRLESDRRQRNSLGSGVVWQAERGLILTNHHVIQGAERIVVTTQDGADYQAVLVGSDQASDVALIRIDADNLTALPLGDSDRLEVGDFVVAIGNPFGLNQTVTSGIVSAKGRTDLGIDSYEDFIQTDASINPGNSGGALINLRGEWVGVNTAIYSPGRRGGNVDIGFAIQVNRAVAIARQLARHGRVQRVELGVAVQDLDADLAAAFNLTQRGGSVITDVVSGSPAFKAGLQPGDVVTDIDGKRIVNSAQLRNTVGLAAQGDELAVTLIREGRALTLTVLMTPGERAQLAGAQLDPRLAGARLQDVVVSRRDGGVARYVRFVAVKPRSRAAVHGIREDDTLLAYNRRSVRAIAELAALRRSAGALRTLTILRGDQRLALIFR